MSGIRVLARAPANIALIKYMGKKDSSRNLPMNASLSLTLSGLCTWAEVTVNPERESSLEILPGEPSVPEARSEIRAIDWSEASRNKAARHAERVREGLRNALPDAGFGWSEGAWALRTANSFPAGAGIASSASSFAAMTLAFAGACAEDRERFRLEWHLDGELRRRLVSLSREGSGSSCRSFDGPWVEWEGDSVLGVPSQLPEVTDLIVVVDAGAKSVSSTDAHARVLESPIWPDRPSRVAKRILAIKSALLAADWRALASVGWADALEMHSLFHSLPVPFSYWSEGTRRVLVWLERNQDLISAASPPVVTLDAGPNVHVLVSTAHADRWQAALSRSFPEFKILRDRQGRGAEILSVPEVRP